MRLDGDLVVLVFIVVLLLLTYKNTRRFAGYNGPTAAAVPKRASPPPRYPGVPPVLLETLAKLHDIPDHPPQRPTVPTRFSPEQCMRILQHVMARVAHITPSLACTVTALHSASLDTDSDGTQFWSISAMLYEATHTTAVQVIVRAVVTPGDQRIHVQSIGPESAPLPPTAGDAPPGLSGSGGYLEYKLPIQTI